MAKNWNLFPSPRGDKLQRTRILTKRKPKSFRPLAGINCNGNTMNIYDRIFQVSVPSRG